MEKFTSALNPVLKYIDSGKFFRQPFQWLYWLLAIASLAVPYVYYKMTYEMTYEYDFSDYYGFTGHGNVPAAVLMTIVGAAAAVFSAIYWIKRAQKLKDDNEEGQKFIAIPLLCSLIIDASILVIALTVIFAILSMLFAFFCTFESRYIERFLINLVACPVGGYLCALLVRALAENLLALAAIANNTKSIDNKTR